MDGNVEEFECAVCLGPFQEPKLLDCHHTFCRKCLEDLASSNLADSKDVILENYKDQKDSLKRNLEELKTVKNIAEDSLKKINEYRQTALSSCQAELQKNYDQNQKKLNTVLSKVNTLKSQIEKDSLPMFSPPVSDVLSRPTAYTVC
ncbi:hypothetical protein LOTGIDRAFT_155029 [Lottia gigantea]|uniref:RING-type domain-containing protein n=1 Tax=Lottia gigantea TaxID=225164 RepID=V3Z4E5_LOTGI|nr:hypothetical protein LOTGIDRAFT_155029 [Lottia gigantea]ESO85543.1 hypothetical protein LOTGIDRAFT_155029 [Lottia gigantea]